MTNPVQITLDFTNQNTQNASIVTIMNLYLYGQVDRPEYYGDHIRDNPQTITVEIDSTWVMSDQGPGRFLQPSFFSAIQMFFNGDLDVTGLPGFSSVTGLFVSGATLNLATILDKDGGDFIFSFEQSRVASDALGEQNLQDLDARGFIFNTSSFQLVPEDVIFQFDGNGQPVAVSGLNIRPYSDPSNPDNFDFISGSDGNNTGNALLGAAYDPYDLGNTVIFTYTEASRDFGSMTLAEFNAAPTEIPQSNLTQVAFGVEVLEQYFVDSLGLYFDDQGREIIYGTNGADTITTGVLVPNIIVPDVFRLVGGGGNDTVTGSIGKDYLEGNADDDTLDGRGGDDILVGGAGSDILIGGSGNDFLFGGEQMDEFGNPRISTAPPDDQAYMDTVDYSGAAGLFGGGITLDTTSMTQAELAAGFLLVTDDAQGGWDILHSIEKIIGTSKKDTFILTGDIFTNGSDISLEIDGGGGVDTLDFSGNASGVVIVPAEPGEPGGGLVLNNFEKVILSGEADQVFFSGEGNIEIEGGGGNDEITALFTGDVTINGGAEVDIISILSGGRGTGLGGAGNDDINAGANSDVFGEAGEDTLSVTSSGAVSYALGGANDDTIYGSGNVYLFGGAGKDTIRTTDDASGIAHLFGSGGDGGRGQGFTDDNETDTLIGSAGTDIFHVGKGDVVGGFNNTKDTLNLYASATLGDNLAGVQSDIIYPATYPDIAALLAFGSLSAFEASTVFTFEDTTIDGVASSLVKIYTGNAIGGNGGTGTLAFEFSLMGYDPSTAAGVVLTSILNGSLNFVGSGGGGGGGAQAQKSAELGNDWATNKANEIMLDGTIFDDVLSGTESADNIAGFMGNDIIRGLGGDDIIYGGLRDDTLYGDEGNDRLEGGIGNDILDGGAGDDMLFGGQGDDILYMSIGADVFDGGLGNDLVSYALSSQAISVDMAISGDINTGNFISIEGVIGSAYNDMIYGDNQNNSLSGGDGVDQLFGRGGNDTLIGDNGSDTYLYFSGDGNDTIFEFGDDQDFDVLVLADINFADVTLAQSDMLAPDDLIITIISTGETIRIVDQFAPDTGGGLAGVENIEFADGSYLNRDDGFTVLMGGSNTAPVAGGVDLGSSDEDTNFTFTAIDLLANSSDADLDRLAVTAVSVDAAIGTIVDNEDGTYTFTPVADFNGDDIEISFTVSDGDLTDTATAFLDVIAVNDAPVAGNVDLGATDEDVAITFTAVDLLAGSTDVDGDALSISAVSVDPAIGTILDNGDGTYTFTPLENFHADNIEISFTVSDGDLIDAAIATLDITSVNDAPTTEDDTGYSTDEDTPISIAIADFLANDNDVDGDVLNIVSVQGAVGGTVAIIGGDIVFTPVGDFNGNASFAYTVSDGNGGQDTATVSINVLPVNDAPDAGAVDFGASDEDTSLLITSAQLLAASSDIDGDALSITSVSVDAAIGNITDNGDGTWTLTPTLNFNGSDIAISFTVSDGELTDTATATLDITPVNDGPIANADTGFATDEDTPVTIAISELLANDNDVDGDTLSVISVQDAIGGLVEIIGGDVVFTPTENFNGDASFSYTVSDGNGGSATASVSITVAPINDGPVATQFAAGSVEEDGTLVIAEADLIASSSDIDGDILTVVDMTVDAAEGSVVDNGDGTWTFTPTPNFNGNITSLAYTVSDGSLTATASITVDVNAVNDAPEAGDVDLGASNEDTNVVITAAELLAASSDIDGDVLSVTNVSVDAAIGIVVDNGDGTFTFAPAENFNGNDVEFSFTVTDGELTDTAIATLDIAAINDGPQAVNDSGFVTDEDTALTIAAADLIANDTDVDGDALNIVSVQDAVGGTVAIVDGNVVFTPTDNFNGDASFTYTVTDSHGGTSIATVSVSVTPVNDGPVATPFAAGSMDEDGTLVITEADLLASSSDIDGDVLSVTAVTVDAAEGSVANNGDGTWTFTPSSNFNGAVTSLSYIVSDGSASDTSSISVDVNAVNDAPEAGDVDLGASDEDTILIITAAQLLAASTDIDGDALGVSALSVDPAIGSIVNNGDDTWTFTPNANVNGTAIAFSFTVTDGALTDTATAILDITAINDGPDAVDDADFSIGEDSVLNITALDLLANDSDLDGDTLLITSVQNAVGGSVAIVSGDVVFSPTENFNGNASFTYTISDGNGGVDTATVSINVTPVNDAPIAGGVDLGATDEDVAITFTQADLLANSTDIDGDSLSIESVSVDASAGSITDNGDGTWTFTPVANFNGDNIEIGFTVTDGGITSSAVATLDVTSVNDGPVATNDTGFVTDEEVELTILASELLANDTDVDGDTLTLVSVQNAVGGIVSLVNGNVLFIPANGFDGTASFSYTVSDGNGGEATASVNVTVNDVPDGGATEGDDILVGTPDSDIIDGLGGDDIISGLGSNDTLIGGAGNDTLDGGAGADSLQGGSGFDVVDYSGSDQGIVALFQDTDHYGVGGSYRHRDEGGRRGDAQGDQYDSIEAIIGSNFRDRVFGSEDGTTALLGGGNDVFDTTYWNVVIDRVDGGTGNDRIWTGSGDDVLVGGAGNDRLYGERGNDTLSGGSGRDRLYGGSGDDVLWGGAGNDRLTGGWGDDTFVFRAGDGHDTITDFDTGSSWWFWNGPEDNIVIDVAGFDSFSDILDHAYQTGPWWNRSTVINFGGGDTLRLNGVAIWELDADMFEFTSVDTSVFDVELFGGNDVPVMELPNLPKGTTDVLPDITNDVSDLVLSDFVLDFEFNNFLFGEDIDFGFGFGQGWFNVFNWGYANLFGSSTAFQDSDNSEQDFDLYDVALLEDIFVDTIVPVSVVFDVGKSIIPVSEVLDATIIEKPAVSDDLDDGKSTIPVMEPFEFGGADKPVISEDITSEKVNIIPVMEVIDSFDFTDDIPVSEVLDPWIEFGITENQYNALQQALDTVEPAEAYYVTNDQGILEIVTPDDYSYLLDG